MKKRLFALPLGALLVVASGACVQVLDIQQDREYVAPVVVDQWGCFATTPATTSSQLVDLFAVDLLKTPSLVSVLEGPPVANAVVNACAPFDASCSSPVGDTWTTDSLGRARLQIAANFGGYLQVVTDNYFPRLIYDDRLRTGTSGKLVFAYLFDKVAWAGAVQQIFQIPLQPNGGFVYAEVYDCQGKFANGISFELEQTQDTTRSFYTLDGVPNPSLSETTGGRGGGFINAPEGTYRLTSKVNATGQIISTNTIYVRGGWDTTVFIGPTADREQY
jgi:hypothetical protein